MEKIIKNQKILFYLFAVLTVIAFLITVISGRDHIFNRFDYKTWEDKYNKSQWVIPNSKNEISDEDLYVYEGARLIQGADPSLVSAEVPPLGKYLIGFSQKLFGFVGIYGIFFSAAALVLLFIFNKILFKSNLFAIIPVFILSIDPLFRAQIGVSLLDTQYLAIILLTFIFVLRRHYIWAGIAAGLFMATKSPFITAVLYVSIFSFFILKKNFQVKTFIGMPLATIITYTLVHLKLFMLGHGFLYFLSVQKYMIHFYQTGATGLPGAVFPLLLSGYWFTWFNKDGFIREWSVLWPIAFLLTLLAIYKMFRKKDFEDGWMLSGLWILFYLIFLIFVPVFSRYLLLALPFMYNFGIWVLSKSTRTRFFVG